MEGEEFNSDLFVDEIEKRPAIWDMKSKEYSNKVAKMRAWEEVVLIFGDSGDTEEQKKKLGLVLQTKWKSMRDKYVRESKRLKNVKSGSGASTKTTYFYYNILTFLQPTMTKNTTESNFELNDDNDQNPKINSENADDHFQTPKAKQCRKKNKLHPVDEYFANMLEKNLNTKHTVEKRDEEDADKLFCLSLYREIKKFPEHMRLKLKIDIYNVILQKQSSQLQQVGQISNEFHHVQSPPSRNYPSTSYSQQYNVTPSEYPQYGYHTTSYDTHAHSQSTYNTLGVCETNQSVVSPPTPSPSASIVRDDDESQASSQLDLFTD